jgi:hypothetical protein
LRSRNRFAELIDAALGTKSAQGQRHQDRSELRCAIFVRFQSLGRASSYSFIEARRDWSVSRGIGLGDGARRRETWAKRVADWQATGLTARQVKRSVVSVARRDERGPAIDIAVEEPLRLWFLQRSM